MAQRPGGGGAALTTPVEWTTLALWGVIVVLGIAIALYAFRAGRTTHSNSLSLLGVGFLLISVGAGILWTAIYLAIHDPVLSMMGATGAMAAGFVAVLASVRLRIG